MTLLALTCSVIPTRDIGRVWLFETKLALGTLAVIASAFLVYHRPSRYSLGAGAARNI
jgi:hypothetical protein